MAGRRAASAPSSRGRHALRSRPLADDLIRSADVRAGDLVLDLGAGTGMLTGALRAVDARVVAVELDPALADGLRRRFARDALVRVVHGDGSRIQLPREHFAVVANLPFAAGTAILRHLLDDPGVPLRRLDAIVEWGLAEKRTRVWPSTLLSCFWGAWYELRLSRRVARTAFAPPPAVDAAVVTAIRRPEPLVPVTEASGYLALLRFGFSSDAPLRRRLPRQATHRLAWELGFAPDSAARDLDAYAWAALHRKLRDSGLGSLSPRRAPRHGRSRS